MKIVVLASRFPYPLERGDKLRLFHQVKGLHKSHDVCLIALTEDQVSTEHREIVEKVVSECHVIKSSRTHRLFSSAAAIFTDTPFSIAYHYDRRVQAHVDSIIDTFQPDVIYCQLTRMSEYVKHRKNAVKILDYMDAFGEGMLRRARVVNGMASRFYQTEGKRMKQYENRIYPFFDKHTVISEEDRKLMGRTADEVSIVPNGVDTSFFKSQPAVNKEYHIGFIGNLGYLPNVSAAEYLINDIMPLLDDSVSILICGARPHPRVQQLARKGVKIQGWVEDIRQAYAKCKIFVAPIFDGTGQQNKILEAMSMGIPCVTTSAVNRGIGATPGEEILVVDSDSGFSESINKLLKNKLLYNRISSNALNFVEARYGWNEMVNRLEKILENARSNR